MQLSVKTLGVGRKVQFSKSQEGNKVVLTVDETALKAAALRPLYH